MTNRPSVTFYRVSLANLNELYTAKN